MLTSHYDFIAKRGLGALVLRAALRPVQLAEISGKSGSLYQLELVAMGQMEREGELVLQLLSDEVVIYTTKRGMNWAQRRRTTGTTCFHARC